MANGLVQDLKNKRNNRYECMFVKLKDFYETSHLYPNAEARKIMDETLEKMCKLTQKHTIKDGESNKVYSRWIDIDKEEYDSFVENMVEDIRNAQEICLEYMLKDTEQDLKQTYIENNIKHIEKSGREKYYNAVKMLVRLDKIAKINNLEENLYEFKKDLISCLKYNDKIKKAEKE